MCIRGFLDPQKGTLPTRATTATRLSQKLVLSIAVLLEFEVESLDVGNAFLDGYTFEQMEQALKRRGIDMPAQRKVILDPPANIWRHLRELDKKNFSVRDDQISEFYLDVVRPTYGLEDAPVGWQLCFERFL